MRGGDRRAGEADWGVCAPRLLHMAQVWPKAHQRLALSQVTNHTYTSYNNMYKYSIVINVCDIMYVLVCIGFYVYVCTTYYSYTYIRDYE